MRCVESYYFFTFFFFTSEGSGGSSRLSYSFFSLYVRVKAFSREWLL
jgi:hypothetical protein